MPEPLDTAARVAWETANPASVENGWTEREREVWIDAVSAAHESLLSDLSRLRALEAAVEGLAARFARCATELEGICAGPGGTGEDRTAGMAYRRAATDLAALFAAHDTSEKP